MIFLLSSVHVASQALLVAATTTTKAASKASGSSTLLALRGRARRRWVLHHPTATQAPAPRTAKTSVRFLLASRSSRRPAFYGKVVSLYDDRAVLEIAEGTHIEITRQAIARAIPPSDMTERTAAAPYRLTGTRRHSSAPPRSPRRGEFERDPGGIVLGASKASCECAAQLPRMFWDARPRPRASGCRRSSGWTCKGGLSVVYQPAKKVDSATLQTVVKHHVRRASMRSAFPSRTSRPKVATSSCNCRASRMPRRSSKEIGQTAQLFFRPRALWLPCLCTPDGAEGAKAPKGELHHATSLPAPYLYTAYPGTGTDPTFSPTGGRPGLPNRC